MLPAAWPEKRASSLGGVFEDATRGGEDRLGMLAFAGAMLSARTARVSKAQLLSSVIPAP